MTARISICQNLRNPSKIVSLFRSNKSNEIALNIFHEPQVRKRRPRYQVHRSAAGWNPQNDAVPNHLRESGHPGWHAACRVRSAQQLPVSSNCLQSLITSNLKISFSNPRVPCNAMQQIDLSAWRENVVQGCNIGGKQVNVGDSAFPSPCTSCICTSEGVGTVLGCAAQFSTSLVQFSTIVLKAF